MSASVPIRMEGNMKYEMKYDQVYVNGKVFTSDLKNPYADAFAVKEGRIAWVGFAANAELQGETVIDLEGKRVLPGFMDSHMHPIMLAATARQITCLPPAVHSIEELIGEIRSVRKKQDSDQWILGWGYDEGKLAEGRTPNRYDLDQGASDAPVCIVRSCGHIRCVNSRVLEMAGIDRNTPDPQGGEICRDHRGEPTGILRENARNLIMDLMPVDTLEDSIDNLLHLSDVLLSQGVTSISDMCNLEPVDYYPVYQKARERGFQQRVCLYYLWDLFKDKVDFSIPASHLSTESPIRAAGIKLIGDGGISGRTAWCSRPYLGGDGEEYGIPVCTEQDIRDAAAFCKKNNAQLAIHTIGDRATDRAINTVCEIGSWLKSEIPWVRIEHASMPTPQALEKAAKNGIAFVTQPIFLYAEIERFLENMGTEWLQTTFPICDILNAGIRLSFSSDAPATPWMDASNPMYGLEAAVTRRAYNGIDCGQKHKIHIETAIRLYTAACGPIMGFSDVGQLTPGFHADFVVLDRDIMEIPSSEIHKVLVEQTYVNGRKVYQR